MTELQVGGVKFKGGRALAVMLGLSTFVGGLYGAFEVYQRYLLMEKKIAKFVAPDLSGFDKRIAVLAESMGTLDKEMKSIRIRVGEIQQIVRDTRQDTRADAASLENGIAEVDKRSRSLDSETRASMRQAEKTLRAIIASANTRFDAKINDISTSNRLAEETIRSLTASASERFDAKINSIDSRLDAFEKRQDKKLQRALDHPLLKQ